MAIFSCVTDSYREQMIQGIHTLTDTYMVSLYTSLATLGLSTTGYTTVDECTGGNYPAGGIVMPTAVAVLDVNTAILTFSNATFINLVQSDVRGCLIYNATKSNDSVAVFDFGSSISLFNSDFTLVVPAATATTGLIRFA